MQERYANIEKENRRLLTRMQEPVRVQCERRTHAFWGRLLPILLVLIGLIHGRGLDSR